MDAPVMIGKSPAIRELRKFVSVAAETDASVLLLGETGVSKEVAARMIHYESDRREKPRECQGAREYSGTGDLVFRRFDDRRKGCSSS